MTRLAMPQLVSYGLLGLPLAMVALPIYVYLPKFYAERSGLSLALIGGALLAARVAAAFLDPLLGWWIERGRGAFARFVGIGSPLLLAGFAALFHPPALGGAASFAWFLGTLMLAYFGFGLVTIAHQSWGAALTQAPDERARVTGVREAFALAGVVLAAAVTSLAGYSALSLAFTLALGAGVLLLLAKAPRPLMAPAGAMGAQAMMAPFANRRFRILFAILIVNGVASAIPATLFLFFAADRLRLAPMAGLFLILYFVAAAFSVAPWVAAARKVGEARAWAGGMLASALVFVWAFGLGPGEALAFGAICILSGFALGADLALPPALLAGVIASGGDAGQREAAYFGVWNWGVQITLALAAGISLPLLDWLGYVPGSGAGAGVLAAGYALLPCVLKLTAAAMLWRAPLRDC
jgi:Na+/melibiose symporter-like transporter